LTGDGVPDFSVSDMRDPFAEDTDAELREEKWRTVEAKSRAVPTREEYRQMREDIGIADDGSVADPAMREEGLKLVRALRMQAQGCFFGTEWEGMTMEQIIDAVIEWSLRLEDGRQ
jgi:hypothetical protein